jgi:hypothetical protein
MKKIILIGLSIICLSNVIYAGGTDKIDAKINTATLMADYSSAVEFSIADNVLLSEWKKWLKNNNSNIYDPQNSMAITTANDWRFGANHTYLKKVAFIKEENLSAYLAYYENLKRESNERDNIKATMILGGLLYLGKSAYDGIKDALSKPLFSGSEGATSAGNNSNSTNTLNTIRIEISKKNYCNEPKSIESFKFYTYINDELTSPPNKIAESYSVISKDKNGVWWTGCVDESMSREEIGKFNTLEEAIKKYYKMRFESSKGSGTFKFENK